MDKLILQCNLHLIILYITSNSSLQEIPRKNQQQVHKPLQKYKVSDFIIPTLIENRSQLTMPAENNEKTQFSIKFPHKSRDLTQCLPRGKNERN